MWSSAYSVSNFAQDSYFSILTLHEKKSYFSILTLHERNEAETFSEVSENIWVCTR